MFLSDISIKRPVLITMVLLVFVLFGALAYFTLPLTFFPDTKIPYVTVQTVYPGAGPAVIESQITKRVEDEITALGLLDSITSYSMEGVSYVIAKFKMGKDENVAVQEVKDKIDAIVNILPSDAQKPAISKIDIGNSTPVMNIIMDGQMSPTELFTIADTKVRERLSQVEGVGRVDVVGGAEREIRVEFDKGTVFENSLSLVQVAGMLRAANLEMPGGNFREGGQDVSVRLKGEYSSLEEVEGLDIPTASGIRKLRQLAAISDTAKTVRQRTIFLDKSSSSRNADAILLQVIRNPSANAVKIVESVQKKLPVIQMELGGKVALRVVKENGTFVKDSLNDTLSNVFLGVLLTSLVLLFFLHDFRSTLIIAMAMPFSIISTFLIMQLMGISLNILSLMGLSTSTGILVSNSVVVLENIFRYKELGHNRLESAGRGTSEVTVAVLASTLTNIAVFLPLANMSGILGQIMANFAYTVVVATVFSILVSFTLTPMLASLILPDKVKRELWISRLLEGMFKSWERGYRRMLEVLLARKRGSLIVVALSFAALVGSFMLAPLLKIELMPHSDSGDITITAELPQGYDMEHTAAILDQIEERVVKYPEVKTTLTNLGKISDLNLGVNLATLGIKLVDKAARSRSDLVLAADMTMVLSDIPNASILVSAVSSAGNMGSAPVDFYLRGPEIEKLEGYSASLAKALKTVPGLMNVDTSSRGGKPEITFNPDRKKLSEAGITVNDLAVTLRAAIDGLVTTTYKEAGNEYDIRVMLKDRTLLTSADLNNIPVATSQGAQPISNFAEMRFAESVGKILHTEKFKTIEFTASLLPGYTQGDVTDSINKLVKELNLPAGYFMTWAGSSQMLQDTVRDMIRVFLLAVILTYMLLAATMESFIQPFVILVTVPLALIGVIVICVWTGTTINMLAMLSIVMLVGIVVNNAILILDYTNQLKKGGMDIRSALIEACPTKLKPIIMANLAMILGTLPMALGIGASGAEMRIAMGIATIGGVISSTIFTLFLIPSIERLIGKKTLVSVPAEAAR